MTNINQTCYFHKNQPLVKFCIKKQCTLPLCSKCQTVHLKQHQKNLMEAQVLSMQAAKEKAEKQLINFISKQDQVRAEMIIQIKNLKERLVQMLKEICDQELEKVEKTFQSIVNKREQLKKISKGSLKNLIFYYGDQLPVFPSKYSVETLLKEFEVKVKKQYPQRQLKKVNSNPNHPMPQFLKSYKKSQDISTNNHEVKGVHPQNKTPSNNYMNQYILLSDRKKETSPGLKYLPQKIQLNGSLNALKHMKRDSIVQKGKSSQDLQNQFCYIPHEKKRTNILSSVHTPHTSHNSDKCPSFLLKSDHPMDDRDKSKSSNQIKIKNNGESMSKIVDGQRQRLPSSSKYKYQGINFSSQFGEIHKIEGKNNLNYKDNPHKQQNNNYNKSYDRSPYKYAQKNNNLRSSELNAELKVQKQYSHEVGEPVRSQGLAIIEKHERIKQIKAFHAEKQQRRSHSKSPQPKKQSLDKHLIKKYRYEYLEASDNTQQKKNINPQHQQIRIKRYTQQIQSIQIQQKISTNSNKLNHATSQSLFEHRQKQSLAQKYKNIKQKYQKNNSSIQKQSSHNELKFPHRKIINHKQFDRKQQKTQQVVYQNQQDNPLAGNSIINQMYSPLKVESK